MPDQSLQKAPTIQIDRLVLDIPGLDPARARALVYEIGHELMGTGLSGEHKDISIALEGEGPDLAVRIAAALRERLL